jgi:hypothetical protein
VTAGSVGTDTRFFRRIGAKQNETPTVVDTHRVASLRAQGVGWKRIAGELGVGVGTLYRLVRDGFKIQETVI